MPLDLSSALEILGLPGKASITLLKKKYREALKTYHPDRYGGKSPEREEKTRAVIEAYKLLLEYALDYPVDFTGKGAAGIPLEEFWMKKFGNDPAWGKGDNDGRY